MHQNETNGQFQLRSLDKDMEETHSNTFPALSAEQASRRYSSTIVLSAVFVALCTLVALLLGGSEIWVFDFG
jgi:hypothetical protein